LKHKHITFNNNISEIDKNTEICLMTHADSWTKYQNKPKINVVNSSIGKRFYSSIKCNSPLSVKPAVIYQNAITDKLIILKENKNKSGIYRWTNLTNNNSYIGSSVNLARRLNEYYNLRILKLHSFKSYIYSSVLKYGHSNFKLEILEYCNSLNIHKREQYFIDLFKPEYNICKIVRSCLGKKHKEETKIKISISNLGKKLTEEAKIKIRESKIGLYLGRKHTEEHKKKLKGRLPWNLGKKYTEEQKKNFKGRLPWNLGFPHKDETLAKITATKLGLNYNERRFVIIKNIETGEINKFVSNVKAAIFLGCSSYTLAIHIKKKKIFQGKFQIYFKIETLDSYTNLSLNKNKRRFVIVKNIETGEINKFTAIIRASVFLECSRSTLNRYIVKKKIYRTKFQIYFTFSS
jgi:group I intron endonuclease